MKHDWDILSEWLDRRIDACRAYPFQVRDEPHARLRDPVTGRHVLLNRARASRTRPAAVAGAAGCPYCQGRTPPTLFYVRDDGGGRRHAGLSATDGPVAGPLTIEDESESLALAAEMTRRGETSTWTLLERMGAARRMDESGRAVPLVHPGEPWLARVFLNATPIVVDPASLATGFVISVPARYHALDLAPLRPPPDAAAVSRPPAAPCPSVDGGLPAETIEAVIDCWRLLEAWGDRHGLTSVPFVNGGKGRASGQSIDCFHAQLIALGPGDRPPFAGHPAAVRAERCPLCELVGDERLRIARVGGVVVAAHPAPAVERTLLIVPAGHVSRLRDLELPADGQSHGSELAIAVGLAARCLASMLGGLPPYNLAVRTGPAAGHLHLELVPRAGVGIAGGFELATGFSVVGRDPAEVAARCREQVRELMGPATDG